MLGRVVYTQEPLGMEKLWESNGKPMATTDAFKEKTCIDSIGFERSLAGAGPGLAGPRLPRPKLEYVQKV